ncbi:MAG: hypothetical protein ACJ8R9_26985 [Steroidobacteraceae bacterium]
MLHRAVLCCQRWRLDIELDFVARMESNMRKVVISIALAAANVLAASAGEQVDPTAAPSATISRKTLMTASIDGQKTVDRVEVREIYIPAHQKPGAHIHPCPVVGNIVMGTILFQVDGQPVQMLKAGDAFFEPANTKIVQFDTAEQPAKFIAYFLLGKDEQNVIKMVH